MTSDISTTINIAEHTLLRQILCFLGFSTCSQRVVLYLPGYFFSRSFAVSFSFSLSLNAIVPEGSAYRTLLISCIMSRRSSLSPGLSDIEFLPEFQTLQLMFVLCLSRHSVTLQTQYIQNQAHLPLRRSTSF